jgi:hypothetical protein
MACKIKSGFPAWPLRVFEFCYAVVILISEDKTLMYITQTRHNLQTFTKATCD